MAAVAEGGNVLQFCSLETKNTDAIVKAAVDTWRQTRHEPNPSAEWFGNMGISDEMKSKVLVRQQKQERQPPNKKLRLDKGTSEIGASSLDAWQEYTYAA